MARALLAISQLSGIREFTGVRMARTILVVDDDYDIAAVLADVLIDEGFDASSVHDGQQALDHLSTTETDLLISDIRMPRLDGLALLRLLREQGWMNPVVIMSAVDTHMPHTIGATFLRKPIDIEDLVALVHQLLGTESVIPGRTLGGAARD